MRAGGLRRALVLRREDDIIRPFSAAADPNRGRLGKVGVLPWHGLMTRAHRACSRSLQWGSAVLLPSADVQTEPAFVSVPHLVLQCGAPHHHGVRFISV